MHPEDTVVEVLWDYAPYAVDPNAEVEFTNMTRVHDAAAVVGVGQQTSELMPDGWYLMSTLTIDVRRVLKDTTGRLVEGALMQVKVPGGDLTLPNGQRIIARNPSLRPLQVGGVYLVFLNVVPEPDPYAGELIVNAHGSVELLDGGAVRHLRRDAPASTTSRTPDWFVQHVRANAHLRRPQ
jgi:hypothetical protein